MKHFISLLLLSSTMAYADISERIFVESPTDTDSDGKSDLIAVTINRPNSSEKLPTIFKISPYTQGGNQIDFHSTDVDLLPQDEALFNKQDLLKSATINKSLKTKEFSEYAQVSADSLGTGKSTGCPTVGDMSETLGAKAFTTDGKEVKADWSNGMLV